MERNITICATDLTVITGHNPYKSIDEIILKFWKRYYKSDYLEFVESLNAKNIKMKKEETDYEVVTRISKENNVYLGNKLSQCFKSEDVSALNQNKESIIKRKSIYTQLRSQLEELQGVVTDREGAIETLERQLVQSGIKSKVQDADMKIQKDLLETETAQSMFREKLKSDTDIKIKELGLAVADAKRKQIKK